VAAGSCTIASPSNGDFCLARYNANGSLDTSFDGDGKVKTPISAGDDSANAVAIQGDGKIVAAGMCADGSDSTNDFCLARYEGVGTANQAPVGVDDIYFTVQGNPLNIASANGVLANDSDPDAGTTLAAVLVAGPPNGGLTLNGNGSFSYTPNASFSGTDTFTYRASDGSATSGVVTVEIAVVGTANYIDGLEGLGLVTSGQQSALKDKLAKAAAFFASGKRAAACDKLNAFISQVNDLTTGKLLPATGAVLIRSANALKQEYGC
jgi:uncharacterized delta-60 repeat protein